LFHTTPGFGWGFSFGTQPLFPVLIEHSAVCSRRLFPLAKVRVAQHPGRRHPLFSGHLLFPAKLPSLMNGNCFFSRLFSGERSVEYPDPRAAIQTLSADTLQSAAQRKPARNRSGIA
jgi:hypothetical protein